MSDYTPTVKRAEDLYAFAFAWRTRDNIEEGDTDLSEMRETQRQEFRRMIQGVKRQAWEEGFEAGERDVFEHERHNYENPCIENPYKEDE